MAIGAEGTILITSLVSSRTREGVVQLEWGDKKAQLSCEEARQHALRIMECAEAAESDAFFIEWLQTNLSFSMETAVQMLENFRSYRTIRETKQ